ncbi:MAG: KH domain-containing protein [Mollicutes bacterium]|nr:KH domain-containing protein [Mollicutes bacterium]
MEKIVKKGKDIDSILEEFCEETGLTKDDIVYKDSEQKKGLFKGTVNEVTIYKKADIYSYAKEFLKEIVEKLGLEVSFETKKQEDKVIIRMYSDNNNILIGHNGNTLRALETIVKQKIQLETDLYFMIFLDVENYKDKKEARIKRLARQIAREVKRTNIEVKMENMNAYERRIVHSALTKFKGVSTKSEGVEPNRHVVISPVK